MFNGASWSNRAHLDSSGDKVSLGMEGDYKCIQHDVAVTFALTDILLLNLVSEGSSPRSSLMLLIIAFRATLEIVG
jgi:hypothetical protein